MAKASRKPKARSASAQTPSKRTKSSRRSRSKTGVGAAAQSKTAALLALLRREDGASIEELSSAAGWQVHSVRGFLSGTVKKKLGLALNAQKGKDGVRRYSIGA
ncbi:MAG: DUF3489 domain-containing protein [Parvularculaceae bacterium]